MKLSLREWRKQQGWSIEFLTNRINKMCNVQIKPVTVRKWEEEGRFPRYDIGYALQKMAKNQIDFSKTRELENKQ
jgi:transcriptional regulator with XRE-family HTH domain